MAAEFVEAEVAAQIGAELGERAPEQRVTQRNGYPRGRRTAPARALDAGPVGFRAAA